MSHGKFIFVFIFCCIGFCSYQCLKMIPQRAQMHYCDELYACNCSLNVRRVKRGGDYFVNFNFTLLQHLGNNVTLYIDFYEHLNNEYKPSFIKLQHKLCDFILKDKFAGPVATRAGLDRCPLIPATYAMKNMYFNQAIPSLWPFEKGLIQVVVRHDSKPNGIIAKADVVLNFVRNEPRKNN